MKRKFLESSSNMNADSKRRKRLWLFGAVATMGLMLSGQTRAYAQQGIAQNLEDSFELHGYLGIKKSSAAKIMQAIITWRRSAIASTCSLRGR